MNNNIKSLAKASVLLPLVGCGSAEVAQESRPNVVLIMADDLGYADISCFGGNVAQTPNIDQMASEGIKLTDFHTNGAVSSPTRAALMTGKYQQRTGVDGVISAADHREVGLAIDEVTIADRLKALGYNTGMFGKWHLGYPAEFNPTLQGFDEFKGFVAGNIDYHSYIDQAGYYDWWNGMEIDRTVKGYITDLITDNSIDFIKRNDPKKTGEPFFLYMPYPAPHYPYQAADDEPVREEGNLKYIRKVAKEDSPRIYKEIIEYTDMSIGKVMATLKELGLEDNTMIIFCSDNGPNGSGNTGGFKGRKGSVYEGGHRVPGVIKYPAAIKAGQVSDEAVMGMDFFPTFVEMAGGNVADDKVIDGVSMLSFLSEGTAPAPRDLFWVHNNRVAMRSKDGWKLVVTPLKDDAVKYELFNIDADPKEETDLSESETERVKAMAKAIDAWKTDVYSCTPSMI
ncbi:MAG: sulfatase-like hydrolase/transferase [Rikenellaceae bacterium]